MNPQNQPTQTPKVTWYKGAGQKDDLVNSLTPNEHVPGELLTIKSANAWLRQASKRPVPKMLFGKFWFEGELCILFADSNLGKSILAVQIANCISRGNSMEPFALTADKQPILYCDFELTEKQFEARYSDNYADHYVFNEHFYRAELDPDTVEVPEGIKDYDEYVRLALERGIVQNNVKVLVIDNLTYVRGETEQAKDALPLMKHLKALKSRYDLSILALAHTPKRDLSQEITRNDLQGSKMLMNFCDSAFTIGESNIDKELRYLKQIKQRNTEQVYGSTNVCLCQITKPNNFLQYEFVGYGIEAEHLRKPKEGQEDSRSGEIMNLKQQGISLREIGTRLGISHQKVSRIIQAAEAKA